MPTFSTPEPISIAVELEVGSARVVAGDRVDTIVEVRPSDPSVASDVRATEQTQIDFVAGRLQVRSPKQRSLGLFGKPGSVDLTIQVPTGSQLSCVATSAVVRSTGSLGACRLMTSVGDIHLEETGPLELRTHSGAITVGRVVGPADVRTGSGDIRLGSVDGPAVVRNSNGGTWIGDVSGELRVKAANGNVKISRAGGDVLATSANGDLRVEGVVRGLTSLKTAVGEIEIGICEGSAARLDVDTSFGTVRNLLERVESPGGATNTVDVRAHTSTGDIVIRRA